jgi:hypothetical protein
VCVAVCLDVCGDEEASGSNEWDLGACAAAWTHV